MEPDVMNRTSAHPPPKSLDPPTFKRATISAHRSQVREQMHLYPTHPDFPCDPRLRLGTGRGHSWQREGWHGKGSRGPVISACGPQSTPTAQNPSPGSPVCPLPSRGSPGVRKCLSLRNPCAWLPVHIAALQRQGHPGHWNSRERR